MVYQGSCLCGSVKFEISDAIHSIIHCHCSLCRKSSGTAFATNGFVRTADFTVTEGQAELSAFESTPGRMRHFCSNCGSPIFSSNVQDPDRIRIRLGVVDSDIVERPMSHNFVSSKADWEDLDAELPRYDGYEPGR